MIKRSDIKGFYIKVFGYYLGFCFIHYIPNAFSISKPLSKTLWRVER